MLLNNLLFDADEILQRINQPSTHGITALEKTRRQLKAFYFKNATDNDEIKTALESAYFDEFPRLKYVLSKLFPSSTIAPQNGPPAQSSSVITQIEPLKSQKEMIETQIPADLYDWQPTLFFTTINEKYAYFNEDLSPLFNKLAVACYKMTRLIENQAYNDEMPYKLMALFYDPQKSPEQNFEIIARKFDKLISTKQDKTIKTPLHDAFVTALNHFPKYADIKNVSSWQSFITQEGFKALSIFSQCAHLQPAFKNMKEAQNFLLKQTYSGAEEHPKLAKLCKSMLISNEGFEAGLKEVSSGWPKKERDNLPIVDIADDSGQYFWVKLPPQDLSAFYLGNFIPGCCQFINGHSSQCVKDGIRLSDNGFYVLLKAKKTNTTSQRMINHEINNKDYTIVAQSYAWISKQGNLCLDSLEWNRSRVTLPVIQDLMSKFTNRVFQVHPEIKYINLGTGGQTPKDIYPKCTIHETMKQGYMYGDAKEQYCIASHIHPKFQKNLQERLQTFAENFKNSLLYLAPYFENIETIPDALVSINSKVTDTLASFLERINLPPQLTIEDFRDISFEDYQRMDASEQSKISTACKIFNSPTEEKLIQWLPTIPDEELTFISIINNDYSVELQIEVLRRLPEEIRIKKILESDNNHVSIIEKNLNQPKSLKKFLELFPSDKCLDILKEEDADELPLLFYSIKNLELLKMILEILSPEQVLFALKEKDKLNWSLLSRASENPQFIRIILEIYSPEKFLTVVKETETLLISALKSPESLKIILDLYPSEERLATVKEKNILKWLCYKENPESLKIILDLYPFEERLTAIKETTESAILLYNSARNPQSLQMILDLYPHEERLAAVKENNAYGKSVLYNAKFNPESLKIILELYPPEERLTAIKESTASGYSVIYNMTNIPKSLQVIFELLSHEQRLQLITDKDRFGESLLFHAILIPESLKIILGYLTPEQKIEVLNEKNIADLPLLFYASSTPESLKIILELYPPEDRLAAVKEKYAEKPLLSKAIASTEILKVILESLPIDHREQALQEKIYNTPLLFKMISKLKDLKIILEILPTLLPLKRFLIIRQALLLWTANNPESLKIILEHYPPEERLAAVLKKRENSNPVLFYSLKNPESLKNILELLPPEQRLQALTNKDKDGLPLLFYIETNPQSLKMTLELLPEEISLTIRTLQQDKNVLEYAASIEKFMNNMKGLANPESIYVFIHSIIQNEDIENSIQALFKPLSQPALFKEYKHQDILKCIDNLHSFWKSRIISESSSASSRPSK